MAHLRRISDGAGDSGSRVESYDPNTGQVAHNRPTVGECLLVGSVGARTFSKQDYWLTTPILAIIEENGDCVKFKTKNSEYEFRW